MSSMTTMRDLATARVATTIQRMILPANPYIVVATLAVIMLVLIPLCTAIIGSRSRSIGPRRHYFQRGLLGARWRYPRFRHFIRSGIVPRSGYGAGTGNRVRGEHPG